MAENNSSAPLLPCPFCGGAAAVQKESPAGGGYFVECKSCRASTNLRYACGDNPVPLLMERWNARAAQAVEAQAAPAAVAVPDEREAFEAWSRAVNLGLERVGERPYYWQYARWAWDAWQARAALAATPAHPATEDSSAGDLAEVKIADEMSREERMIVLQRDSDGTPTVWCDPEIADIVCALNSGGVKTVASCSGHGVKPGGVALADGRQLLLLESLEAFNSAMSAITQAEVQAEPVMIYHGCCTIDCGEHGHHDVEMLKMIPAGAKLYTAPQAQPADALDAKRWQYAMDWETKGFAVCRRVGSTGQCWEPIKNSGSIDAAMAAAQEGGNASTGKDGAA